MLLRHGPELARFVTVAVIGLIADIATAWLLWTLLGLKLIMSAGIGFLVGALVNYLLHELWTFKRAESQVSVHRLTRYGVALGATLAARLCAVYLLSRMFDAELYALHILILATGLSFIVNYAITKMFVFKSNAAPNPVQKGKDQ